MVSTSKWEACFNCCLKSRAVCFGRKVNLIGESAARIIVNLAGLCVIQKRNAVPGVATVRQGLGDNVSFGRKVWNEKMRHVLSYYYFTRTPWMDVWKRCMESSLIRLRVNRGAAITFQYLQLLVSHWSGGMSLTLEPYADIKETHRREG